VGDDEHLAWLQSVAESDTFGFDVGEMPDAVYVLHPIYEGVDDTPIGDTGWGLMPNPLPAGLRRVTWREYAERHGAPMFVSGRGPGHYSLPGVWDDESVISPIEGGLFDELVWNTIFDLLIRHSGSAPDTPCTAYYNPLVFYDPVTDTWAPNIFRGRLGQHPELFKPDGIGTPQNVWPDDHGWVLLTHSDAWATQISGPTELIEALIGAPTLDTVRVREVL
jgi:hypothetical protein